MPRFSSGSCPTCASEPVLVVSAATGAAVVDAVVEPSIPSSVLEASSTSESAAPRAAAACVQSTVQSANDTAIDDDVNGVAPAQSAGCAPADAGDSASAADAIAAA